MTSANIIQFLQRPNETPLPTVEAIKWPSWEDFVKMQAQLTEQMLKSLHAYLESVGIIQGKDETNEVWVARREKEFQALHPMKFVEWLRLPVKEG